MKKSIVVWLLLLIFLITFFSRIIISFETDKFSYDAYFTLRQVENIKEKGVPLFEDPLSFGGRSHLFPPVFYYLVSFFSFLGLTFAAKLVPNILFSLIIIPVYLICFRITKHRATSLISAFVSGFIPVIFITINDVSEYSLVLFLTLFVFYFIMKLENKFHLRMGLFFLVLLVFTHTSSLILIISLLLFLLLLIIESIEITNREKEFILFSSFLALWFNFIVYKKAFLAHGPLVIWQNIPLEVLTNYFFDLNIIQAIYYTGVLSVIFGIYSIYHVLFKMKKKFVFLFVSLFLSTMIMLWFKLIPFQIGLMYLSISLIILSSHSIKLLYSYFRKTKMIQSANWFLIGILIVFILTAIIPSFNLAIASLSEVPSEEEFKAMFWLEENIDIDSVVLARPEEGHLLNYLAKKRNVIDNNYLLVEDAQQRFEDVEDIFSLRLKAEVVRRLNKYDAEYLYFSELFGNEKKLYYAEEDCFTLLYNETVKIYEVHCSIE